MTPNHFLIGQLGGNTAPNTTDEQSFDLKKQWRRVQELVRHFWGRWLKEWVPALNALHKWRTERNELKIGDVVLVLNNNTPRAHWPLGKIRNVHPGRNGRIREATAQTEKKSSYVQLLNCAHLSFNYTSQHNFHFSVLAYFKLVGYKLLSLRNMF